MTSVSRREIFKKTLLSLGAAVIATKSAKAMAVCSLTPEQTEGPFYPISDQLDKDNDLTWVKGVNLKAEGEVVLLKGIVTDQNCQPVEGALVEIWQACATGKYNHPGDPNPSKLDPNFQYWGRSLTNAKGEYLFKTIIPGAYKATSTWTRPPHIHLKVHRRGFIELTTQVYFKGEQHNTKDRILQSLSPLEQHNVIVDFKASTLADGVPELGPRVGLFNIAIREA